MRREDDEAIADIEANHALSETDSMNLGELSRVPIQRSVGAIELRLSLASVVLQEATLARHVMQT